MDSSRRCNLSRQDSTFIDAQLAKLRMYRIHGLKMEQKNSKNGKWAKVLYQQSHLPDNYTDPNLFLEGLKRNLHFQPVGARTALLAATRVSTQIGVTIIFWAVFLQLKYSSPHWQVTYSAFTCFTLVAYMMVDGFRHFWEIIRSALYFLAVGYGCTPILKTLTSTISTDTIYAMSAVLMTFHIAFHCYGMEGSFVSPYLSLNAAVCGAICLASRLQDTEHAFILLSLAVQAFALFPELYEGLHYTPVAFVLSVLSAVLCLVSVSSGPTAVILFLALIFTVNVACPLFFVWAQKYKDNIHGPWDEAMISTRKAS